MTREEAIRIAEQEQVWRLLREAISLFWFNKGGKHGLTEYVYAEVALPSGKLWLELRDDMFPVVTATQNKTDVYKGTTDGVEIYRFRYGSWVTELREAAKERRIERYAMWKSLGTNDEPWQPISESPLDILE